MLHSSFDLEMHARTVQANALRDADRKRLLAAARDGQAWVSSVNAISLLFAAIKARLVRRRVVLAHIAPTAADESAVPNFSMMVVSEEPRAVVSRRPARAAEPYAAMVVIARSANVPLSRQPGEVREC